MSEQSFTKKISLVGGNLQDNGMIINTRGDNNMYLSSPKGVSNMFLNSPPIGGGSSPNGGGSSPNGGGSSPKGGSNMFLNSPKGGGRNMVLSSSQMGDNIDDNIFQEISMMVQLVDVEPPKGVTKNVNWNPIIEKNVLEIGEKAKGYKTMHTQESEQVSTKYDILMFCGIVLGPLAGLLSSIGAILAPPDTAIILPILSTCVGFLSGIFVAITKYGKYEENMSKHKLAASKYTSLESNVRRQLALCRLDRVNAVQYLEWIGNSFDELFLASPLVAKKIYEQYIEMAKENGLVIPDEYKIIVNVDQRFSEIKKPQGKIEITRESINKLPELNKFSDGRMDYELNRMLNLK